jgi:HJR/Mrr/RecB family endonuclease
LLLHRRCGLTMSPTSRVRSQDSSAQNLATNNGWLLLEMSLSVRKRITTEPRRRARSGCTNKPHATRQLCERMTMRWHDTTVALRKLHLACETVTVKAFSGTSSWHCRERCSQKKFRTWWSLLIRRRENRQSSVLSYPQLGSSRRWTLTHKAEIAQLYRLVVSQITLLYMRDLFESDPELDNVELAGHVRSVNPATVQWEYPCLISVATDRATYSTLNLHDVHPDVCLHHLNALVSHHPHLVKTVTPIRDFDLARYSFVENVDVVAGLDSRPDLTKMSPTEFEHFVRQLFEASGLEGWTTQRSGDDGVDAVVINRDPLVGGLTIVQAKRYLAVIGISHIRELVGAMDEKGAGRGILVTTSWFTAGCWIKAEQNNRIELIDGPRLRHLVKEHINVLVAPPAPRSRTWHP